jgi:hypothetical protein
MPTLIIDPLVSDKVFIFIVTGMCVFSCVLISFIFYDIFYDFITPWFKKRFKKRLTNKAFSNIKGVKDMHLPSPLIPRYADVWVRSFIDPYEPTLGCVTYKDILFQGNLDTYAWGWIESKAVYGWIEKRKIIAPPAEPVFYASSDEAFEDAKHILEEYNNDKEVIN